MEVKAFPGTPTFDQDANRTVWQEGMNLRDYFAAKVMQDLYTEPDMCMSKAKAAEWCYQIADAMMEARNGNTE